MVKAAAIAAAQSTPLEQACFASARGAGAGSFLTAHPANRAHRVSDADFVAAARFRLGTHQLPPNVAHERRVQQATLLAREVANR